MRKNSQPEHIRTALAVEMARLNIIREVPVYVTGAHWRALSCELTGSHSMPVTKFCAYVQSLVMRDLSARRIEPEPLCVREARAKEEVL